MGTPALPSLSRFLGANFQKFGPEHLYAQAKIPPARMRALRQHLADNRVERVVIPDELTPEAVAFAFQDRSLASLPVEAGTLTVRPTRVVSGKAEVVAMSRATLSRAQQGHVVAEVRTPVVRLLEELEVKVAEKNPEAALEKLAALRDSRLEAEQKEQLVERINQQREALTQVLTRTTREDLITAFFELLNILEQNELALRILQELDKPQSFENFLQAAEALINPTEQPDQLARLACLVGRVCLKRGTKAIHMAHGYFQLAEEALGSTDLKRFKVKAADRKRAEKKWRTWSQAQDRKVKGQIERTWQAVKTELTLESARTFYREVDGPTKRQFLKGAVDSAVRSGKDELVATVRALIILNQVYVEQLGAAEGGHYYPEALMLEVVFPALERLVLGEKLTKAQERVLRYSAPELFGKEGSYRGFLLHQFPELEKIAGAVDHPYVALAKSLLEGERTQLKSEASLGVALGLAKGHKHIVHVADLFAELNAVCRKMEQKKTFSRQEIRQAAQASKTLISLLRQNPELLGILEDNLSSLLARMFNCEMHEVAAEAVRTVAPLPPPGGYQITPMYFKAHYYLATSRFKRALLLSPPEAEQAFNQAIEIFEQSLSVYRNYGQAVWLSDKSTGRDVDVLAAGLATAAAAQFQKTSLASESLADNAETRSRILAEMLVQSRKYGYDSLAINKSGLAYEKVAIINHMLGLSDQAWMAFEAAISEDPSFYSAWLNFAVFYHMLNQQESTREIFGPEANQELLARLKLQVAKDLAKRSSPLDYAPSFNELVLKLDGLANGQADLRPIVTEIVTLLKGKHLRKLENLQAQILTPEISRVIA